MVLHSPLKSFRHRRAGCLSAWLMCQDETALKWWSDGKGITMKQLPMPSWLRTCAFMLWRAPAMHSAPASPPRRRFAAFALLGYAATYGARAAAQASGTLRSFMDRAFEMKRRAEAAGDQPYGAVVVKDGRIVAESPSRVVTARDPDAHAEREAMRLAKIALGSGDLAGCILVSSSRPCSLCERAAFEHKLLRMVYGAAMIDAGPPRAV